MYVLSLLFLPHSNKESSFKDFQDLLTTPPPQSPQRDVLSYQEDTWPYGTLCTPICWSIFGHRTSESTTKQKDGTGSEFNWKTMSSMLQQECHFLSRQCQLVCEDKLK